MAITVLHSSYYFFTVFNLNHNFIEEIEILLCILMLRYPLEKKKKVEFILLDLALSNLCENRVWGWGNKIHKCYSVVFCTEDA